MSMVQNLLNRVFWWRDPPDSHPSGTEGLQSILHRWESPILQIQNILVWQQPMTSASVIAAFNILFWTVICLEWKFYGLVFTAVTLAAVADCARYLGLLESGRDSMASVWPSPASPQTFRVLSANELHEYITALVGKSESCYQRLRQLRAEQPGTFCGALCVFFLFVSVIGKAVSGSTIIYLILMSVFTLPAVLVRFPSFLQFLPNLSEASGSEVDDYLPQASGETIKILSLHESVDDGLPSSNVIGDATLYPDLTTMPSYEHSMDYLLEPDVDIPSPRQLDGDSESDISETHELQFKAKHFKGSSSSSSGDDLSKGLRFRGNKARRQSSSDSNESFEFVSKDEL